MIVGRYLGLALVLGVSTALVGVVVSQPSNSVRLFVRCLRWGLATGAATGAVFGGVTSLIGTFTSDPGAALGLTLIAVVIGGVAGALVALLPTLIAGLLVTTVLRQRHPHPVSATSVERDLTGVSAAVVAVLDVILLVGVLASGADFASTVISLLLLVLGNACVVLMLWRARRSISRLWLDVTAG